MLILVRETRIRTKDNLHKYNIYVQQNTNTNTYFNIYTCMCCKAVFVKETKTIDEEDTGATIDDISTETLTHWFNYIDDNTLKTILKNIIEQRR